MPTGLARVVLLVLIVAALTPEAVLTDAFDEETLRRNVTALAGSEALRELLSVEELKALRAAASNSSSEEIDRLLASKAHVQISINPEARVKAHRTRVSAPAQQCTKPSAWLVRIVNEGYVTAPLTVSVRGVPSSEAIKATLAEGKLSGAAVEYRLMQVSINSAGSTDVTLLFGASPDTSDLGSRAEVSVLVSCRQN